jgi:hypothetical protein
MLSWRISFAGKDKMYWILHVKCPIFLSDFIKIFSSPIDFSQKSPTSNFMEIRSMGAHLILADRRTNKRTDVTKETGAFRDCGKAPENKLCLKLENRYQHIRKVRKLKYIYGKRTFKRANTILGNFVVREYCEACENISVYFWRSKIFPRESKVS